ncbi:hypothetical protein Lsed01_01925 [Demequina sediminis]|uniref:SEC-C motif-containing protein n=1 Tax=Demequina sediminis TaxID=1930058 RepID=A0ABP9WK51_9MICO|nr:SEC-C domain-containing protein [Demequina sediminis]
MVLPLSRTEAADLVLDTLARSGPSTGTSLATALSRRPELRGIDAGLLLDDLLDSNLLNAVGHLPDGRWCHVAELMRNRVATHRLSATEAAHGFIAAFPDMAPLLAAFEAIGTFEDGSPVEVVYPEWADDGDWGIPAEVLPDDGAIPVPASARGRTAWREGDIVAVAAHPQGMRVTRLTARTKVAPYPSETIDALREIASQPRHGSVQAEGAAWAMAARFADLWSAPTPPFSDLVAQSGAVSWGEHLLPPGTDPEAWRSEQEARSVATHHRISLDAAMAVVAVADTYRHIVEALENTEDVLGSDPNDIAATGGWDADLRAPVIASLPWIADPDVATAVLGATMATGGGLDAVALGILTEAMHVAADEPATAATADTRAAISWLAARASERLGAVEEAEYELREGLEASPQWAPLLADLAYYASDRGMLAESTALARRAGLPLDDPLAAVLAHLGRIRVRSLGRNQPCWCGSGKKYKVCHEGLEDLPLEERATWTYQKACMHLDRGTGRETVLPLAVARGRHLPGGLLDGLRDPLVTDVALVEGGGFSRFLRDRRDLLPEDELALAEQWLMIERSLWEVVESRPTRGMTMRDVRTGDQVDVREATASRTLKAGDFVCCRVLPAGETWQIFGGVEPVAMGQRAAVLALLDDPTDPAALVEALSVRLAPTRLVTSDGDAMVMGEIVMRVTRTGDAEAALDRGFERTDDAPPTWLHLGSGSKAGGRTVLASMTLNGDLLTLEASSANRLDAALDLLRAAIPGLTVLSDRRVPIADMLDAPGGASLRGPATGGSGVEDATVKAVLAEVMAQHEAQWLDEQIPALDGLTPREAAADPTRRDDLVRLLNSFPQTEDPTQMSAPRLRVALGLA